MQKMISLRHLEIEECSKLTHMPHGLRHLTSLQTLTLFTVSMNNSISKFELSGGLNELNRLNNLRGKLAIVNLDRVKDAKSEFKAANLKDKQHLQSLQLEWNPDVVDDEMSLEYLQPHPNLKWLDLRGYGGVRFPSWLSSATTHLIKISIKSCFRCQYLPPLDQLPSLKILYLGELAALEYVSDSITFASASSSSTSAAIFFPSLRELKLYNCLNLKGWWREVGTTTSMGDRQGQHLLLPSFPALSSLSITKCPKLTSMPLFPYIETSLWLRNTSVKPLQQTMAEAAAASPLSKLKDLGIKRIEDLESLAEEWLRNFSSLKSLWIEGCHRLAWTLSRDTQHLSCLEKLILDDCEEIHLSNDDDDDGGIQWQALKSLSSLTIDGLPKVESLPEGI